MSADPFGAVIFTSHYDTDPPTITIDQADPHVLVTDDILTEAAVVGPRRFWGSLLRVEPPTGTPPPTPWASWHDHCLDAENQCDIPDRCFTNWLLHLDIPGRHLVYRIGKYRAAQNVWEASWPD